MSGTFSTVPACACAYVRVSCSSMMSLRRALELIRFLFAR